MKVNLKYFFLFWLFLSCGLNGFSQGKKEKLEAMRIAFITKQINLTTSEAQSFWPVYNEYHDKLEAARKAFKTQYNKSTNLDALSDKEAELILAAETELKQKEYLLFKEYYERFKKVLPVKKVLKLRKAEEDFKQELLKMLKSGGGE